MKCPKCDVALKKSDRKGVEIDYCGRCRGVWLDRGELDKIIDLSIAERQFHRPSSTSRRPRPVSDDVPDYSPYEQMIRQRKHKSPYYKSYPSYQHYHAYPKYKYRKKKSLLGELFDLFD